MDNIGIRNLLFRPPSLDVVIFIAGVGTINDTFELIGGKHLREMPEQSDKIENTPPSKKQRCIVYQ